MNVNFSYKEILTKTYELIQINSFCNWIKLKEEISGLKRLIKFILIIVSQSNILIIEMEVMGGWATK